MLVALGGGVPATQAAVFPFPTNSSPLAMTLDGAYIWVVSPDDDKVYIINAATDNLAGQIAVGDEPRSVALDPNNNYAYVANAADDSVSVVHITGGGSGGILQATYVTGAEPWSTVISPDGKRVFVANSAQDTLTVLKADVTFPITPTIIGNIRLDNSACNAGDSNRRFQPRGLAVTVDNTRLFVTRFLSHVRSTGVQGTDAGHEGLVCRLDINTGGTTVPGSVTAFTPITLAPQPTGFSDANSSPTTAFPNQLQSIVIRGNSAYLPNVAASPAGPLGFGVDTQAFVSVIGGVSAATQTDVGSAAINRGASPATANLNLGAVAPEAGKPKLFFSSPWAIAFATQSGAGTAYVVSAGSDLLVKLNVDAAGTLGFTGGASTTRYVDLNNPDAPATAGRNAGKTPRGILIRSVFPTQKAYVANYLGRNVSVVDLSTDAVVTVIPLSPLPAPGSPAEQRLVGAEMFYSSRGDFVRPGGTSVSTRQRLSAEGRQSCASCHFNGWTDGVVWQFAAGPRRSLPLNGVFNPADPDDQRLFGYSALFDEVQDYERYVRDLAGPGPLAGGALDPDHGLLISDGRDINLAPAVLNAFALPNAGRQQLAVKLPGSATAWPALDALREWVRAGIRTPRGALVTTELTAPAGAGVTANPDATGGLNPADVTAGQLLFLQAGCATCHGGGKWTGSWKSFTSPPVAVEIATEGIPAPVSGLPDTSLQYLNRFLKDVGSFNRNVVGQGNLIAGTPAIGAAEVTDTGFDALGRDYNGDGKGVGYNTPSLLGIGHLPPYLHNGACETLACVLRDPVHRTRGLGLGQPDPLVGTTAQAQVVAFLKSLDGATPPPSSDSDGDSVQDSTDNCSLTANASQLDANGDGYGNACDADLNESGLVTTADFAILRSVLNQPAASSATAAAADLNGSGTVTTADFAILRSRLNTAPGPSGLLP